MARHVQGRVRRAADIARDRRRGLLVQLLAAASAAAATLYVFL